MTLIIEYPLTAKLKTKLGCSSLFGRYMHLQRADVVVGQEVSVGQQIGTMGNSGTTYAHLHIDLYKDTIEGGGVHWRYDKDTQLMSYLDPYEFIQAHLVDDPDTVNLQPYQRVVGSAGVNYRKASSRLGEIIQEFAPDEVLDFKGYVRGESINGNDIWFVGKYTGGYAWSGAFTDSTTHDLPDLTPPPEPDSPTPAPTPSPAMFGADSPLVSRVIPSPNFADVTQVPQFIVIHQWDDPAKKPTQQGVINHFLDPKVEISAHYVVNNDEVVQMVKETKRAWHAGKEGNNGIGLEFDPNGGEAMYERGRNLIADIKKRNPNLVVVYGHDKFMNTVCPKYIDLNGLQPVASDLETRVAIIETKISRIKELL